MSKSSPDFSLHTGAAGGPGLGRTRDFLKESDAVDANIVKRHGPAAYKNPTSATQDYGSGKDSLVKRTGDKSLKAIKPRS